MILHMLANSWDSFFVLLLLSPWLKPSYAGQLAIWLGVWDATASYVGGVAEPHTAIFVWCGCFILAVAFAFMQENRWRAVIMLGLPILLAFDNLTSFVGHPTTMLCAWGFGLASLTMALLGWGLASVLVKMMPPSHV